MKTIDEDIKNEQIKNVYLLFGEERYLLLQYRDRLVDAIVDRTDTMNFTRFEGDGIKATEIIDLAETLPFFSDKRCILMENTPFFSDTPEDFLDYMGQIPENTYLIFCEKELKKTSALYKRISKYGRAVEFTRLDGTTLIKWIKSKLRTYQKEMTPEALEIFVNSAGEDMGIISMELEKIVSYVGEATVITADDIRAICSAQISDKVFDMIDAISFRNQKKALDLYYDLLSLKVAPIKTLMLIARHYRILYTIKTMQNSSRADIAAAAGIRDFMVKKYQPHINGYSATNLKEILEELCDLDYAIKSGNLSDQLAVETFILKHST